MNLNKARWLLLAGIFSLAFVAMWVFIHPIQGVDKENQSTELDGPIVTPKALSEGSVIPTIPAFKEVEITTAQHTGELKVMSRPIWHVSGVLKEHLNTLKAKAQKGSLEAKYIIAMNFKFCVFAPQNSDALQAKLEEIASYSDAGTAADNVIRQFHYCEGITKVQKQSYARYLEEAANSGFVAAQEAFGNLAAEYYMKTQGFNREHRDEYIAQRSRFKEKKWAFLNQAAQHGSEKAMMTLSSMHYSQQLEQNSFAQAYALNKLLMEITEDGEVYNRHAWLEQKQYPKMTEQELVYAQQFYESWLKTIYENGTLYPSR
ncbi:hypothetical protein [Pseudoalteromonas luteoviolacea]|uniref:Uncharacterized protein n=1 Tax=Pseudoalteromonas luteoviolacea H33 TaxID=1365251 RepID=A0A167BU15_9GAMM|nr:hypothetical protein [Pseudoalteromonas luteoviolacea]KZN46901.1 hypothetical protein N476_03115 [Pseudoalteromonas luteoviolacea H33]KZN74660.1 hypothetical protein N477_21775 [Pseudoalteromonas luteoviolacea H33-S]MBQ4880529.1 hypothetical protein [Pseudoalteromonas luteoviolacea]MBQ4909570.1 hypothetical protein [Pseudoalteromonas luteoviolacea]